ncbi:beta-galactosidase-like isoform 2-T2 [Discoglossus pictus]
MGARFICILLLSFLFEQAWGIPSFTIDYNDDCFKKDGNCFRYISGSIHYFRIPAEYWRDRLMKMYMAGLNAVQIYVPWNFHEPQPGVYDFKGDNDLERFLDLTNELGFLAIIRPGPYICAEWDMGGLPAWLLNKKDIVLRTSDPDYLTSVDSWLSVLLPKLRPRLYNNGGNIISVQVENEYGSYHVCDHSYMRHLHIKFRLYLGNEVVLFTTDGNTENELLCGSLQGIYATVDFGPVANASLAFEPLRKLQPRGPLVNSEFYTGWLDHWGEKHSLSPSDRVSQGLMNILETGASINMYMFAGGTNFGFWNGADYKNYNPVTTSYDYDAPLTEAGDPTQKIEAIRTVISKFQPVPQGPIPPATQKYKYGFISLSKVGRIFDLLNTLSPGPPIVSQFPLTFEDIKQYFGFVLYRTHLVWDIPLPTKLSAGRDGVHDRAYISIDGKFQGVLERDHVKHLEVTGNAGQWLDLLVENMGRINFGADFNDFKGLVTNVTLGADILQDWTIYPLNMDGVVVQGLPQLMRTKRSSYSDSTMGPALYSGTFSITVVGDTFLKLPKWTKGQVWINGFNLGRYWPARGPQITLYVPGILLSNSTVNTITVLELEHAPDVPVVLFLDQPILDGLP